MTDLWLNIACLLAAIGAAFYFTILPYTKEELHDDAD